MSPFLPTCKMMKTAVLKCNKNFKNFLRNFHFVFALVSFIEFRRQGALFSRFKKKAISWDFLDFPSFSFRVKSK